MPYGPPSFALGLWAAPLLPASWRGLPFAVSNESLKPGRRTVLHEYPFRDKPWVEDLGLATITVTVSGFLIGDDVFAQRAAMRAACDQAGPGTLVHPSLGPLQGNVIGPSFATTERGRRIAFEFTFIQTALDQPIYPSASVSTQASVFGYAAAADIACAADFVADVAGAVALGITVVQTVVAVALGFAALVIGTPAAVSMLGAASIELPGQVIGGVLSQVGQVGGILNDAGVIASSVMGLVPPSGYYYGRYSTAGLTSMLPATATAASQLAAAVAAGATCASSLASCLSAAASTPLTLAQAVQAAIAALLATITSPKEQLRVLAELAGYGLMATQTTAPVGGAIATATGATAAMIRRAALTGLARAEAVYQPTSLNDAQRVRAMLTALLDAEILLAADDGDNNTFLALKAVRSAIVLDLVTRGSKLPSLVTVYEKTSLPSLAVAWQLYGDASRSDELIARNNPVAPGFMPLVLEALSS
jgi:prophage DNA circulation protein